MRDIAIVGAGQTGLHLGVGLLRRGYRVRLVTNRTADQVRTGRVLSSQAMLAPSLDLERQVGLELWRDACPPINGVHLTWLGTDGQVITRFSAPRARPALSVDQRVKMPAWMDLFESAGGLLEIEDIGVDDLDRLAGQHDLVVVAAGKGEISGLFPRDRQRIEFDRPQRHLALAYLRGVTGHPVFEGNDFGKHDGVGEMFMFPALTTSGPCHIITVEAVPDGPMDVFAPQMSGADVLAAVQRLAAEHFPWLGRRLRHATLTDPQATLVGRFAPNRRQPVADLPSGRPILGAGDVLVLNDPLTGQGSNNAAKCAAGYLRAILDRGADPFDAAWMHRTFEAFAAEVEASTRWTNATLRPWPAHVRDLLADASRVDSLAQLFAEGFGDPAMTLSWWQDREAADRIRAKHGVPVGAAR